jgi:hypothetical protein
LRICSFYNAEGSAKIGNRTWRWEFSDQFGPLFVDDRGVPLKDQQLSERHPVWRHFEAWLAKYRGTEVDPHDDVATLQIGPAPKVRVVHKAKGIRDDGTVSALCFSNPRGIDLREASWSMADRQVTCKACLRLIANPAKVTQ